jgi:hypothetical protein
MDDFVFKVELVAEVRARVLRSWPNVVAMPGARTPANQAVIEPIWAEAKWPSGQPSPGQRRHGFGASRLRSIKWRRPGTGRRPRKTQRRQYQRSLRCRAASHNCP